MTEKKLIDANSLENIFLNLGYPRHLRLSSRSAEIRFGYDGQTLTPNRRRFHSMQLNAFLKNLANHPYVL